ncbi:MAG: hypothetical protein IV298_09525 [Cylindrospermopsis raciborskii KL1]|uniref:hypothetical protein n=1 Tax=Cylindrospermopsis raciborskii TaxID=77022 RepID=UPI001A27A9E8|nr:hypothetical protein [Cylindrospermopsis raciborskii]MBG0743710.1 hypothetical protein [Cylindrospermopsis raciborskii KL1]
MLVKSRDLAKYQNQYGFKVHDLHQSQGLNDGFLDSLVVHHEGVVHGKLNRAIAL